MDTWKDAWDKLTKEQQDAITQARDHLKPLIVEEALMLKRAFPDLRVEWSFEWHIAPESEQAKAVS